MSIKYDVLARLGREGGGFVSGQELAKELGVTRSAVWKAITSLRDEGVRIESVTNRGYRLVDSGDVLSAELIELALLPQYKGIAVSVFDSIDSTNNEAKRRLAGNIASPELIVASCQTAGRGRMGREFYSPAQTGLYMSLALQNRSGFSGAVYTTTAAAVAVVRAIKSLTGIDTGIKWVNDIYLNGHKVCGILTEAVTDFESGAISGLVIGIGINLRTELFPDSVGAVAASIGELAPGRSELAAAITNELMAIIERLPDRGFLSDYRRCSLVLGKEITFTENGITKTAKAVNIDDFGGLLVKLDNGEETVLSTGEISVRLA
jgi:BirA family biotin operon repressor/biotin-[acetyl-CoA-carboxylase] ligase